jgi:hypothetical protein
MYLVKKGSKREEKGQKKNQFFIIARAVGARAVLCGITDYDTRELIDKGRRVSGKLANSPASSDVLQNNQKVWMETQSTLGCPAAQAGAN